MLDDITHADNRRLGFLGTVFLVSLLQFVVYDQEFRGDWHLYNAVKMLA